VSQLDSSRWVLANRALFLDQLLPANMVAVQRQQTLALLCFLDRLCGPRIHQLLDGRLSENRVAPFRVALGRLAFLVNVVDGRVPLAAHAHIRVRVRVEAKRSHDPCRLAHTRRAILGFLQVHDQVARVHLSTLRSDKAVDCLLHPGQWIRRRRRFQLSGNPFQILGVQLVRIHPR
jgi:hypothetical protein